jgi:hypothetical protein
MPSDNIQTFLSRGMNINFLEPDDGQTYSSVSSFDDGTMVGGPMTGDKPIIA